ncbi:MAG: putative toxin-antitoxin system toxin component, PIN family [Acutalibacteraceae bacterium]
MRIMLDTNILISSLLFPSPKMKYLMQYIFLRHKLVLSSFVVDELKAVASRKFPHKAKDIDNLLQQMSFELVYTPSDMEDNLFAIRDKNDYPVLYTAIIEDVDILITGDRDFLDIDIERPEIMTPAQFFDKYIDI